MAKKIKKSNSKMADRITCLVINVAANVGAHKGLKLLKDQTFMQDAPPAEGVKPSMNFKKTGASAGTVAIGAGLAIGVDNKYAHAAGSGIAAAGANHTWDDVAENLNGLGGLGATEQYVDLYSDARTAEGENPVDLSGEGDPVQL